MLHLPAQAYFDGKEFDPPFGYEALSPRDRKIGHIQLHVAKAAMKLVNANPEIIISEVIPDTAIYRSQIINLLIAPVKKIVVHELEQDYPITLPSSEGWEVDATAAHHRFQEEIVLASGNLATYLERLEHGKPGDEDRLRLAVSALDYGSRGLAELYGVDSAQAHLRRLEHNMGRPLPANLVS